MLSKRVFYFFSLFCCFIELLGQENCGRIKVGQGLIKKGNIGKRGDYPWTAAITNKTGFVFCGGTILTNKFVLTAAHCIHGKKDEYKFTPENITVVLGAHDLNKTEEAGREFLNVTNIKIHQDWNVRSDSHDADIAILTLEKYVNYSKFIQPICLISPDSNLPSTILKGFAVGFRLIVNNTNNTNENVLKYVNTSIQQSNEECFYSNDALLKLSSNRTFCGGDRNGSGVCGGDSGNGLFIEERSTYYLRGIVASGLLKNLECDVYNYAVFTNVPKFYEWIIEKIDERFLTDTESRIYLLGSRLIHATSQWKVYILVQNLKGNSSIKVEMQPKGIPKHRLYKYGKAFAFEELEFDLTPEITENLELKITTKIKSICMEQAIKLINISESPIVFILFNKPIYKTNEIFSFRVFILTRDLLPIPNYGPMDVQFRDSRNMEILKYKTKTNTNQFGVFEGEFSNLHNRQPGVWTIEVKAGSKKVIKTFEVQDYHQNQPEVFVDAPSNVAFVDRKIYLNIYTKDPYGRYAEIFIKANFINSSRIEIEKFLKRVPLTDRKTLVALDFQDDLEIKYPTADMDLSFSVQITGANPTAVLKNMKMLHKGRNTIQVIRKAYFKPLFKFPIKVRVIDLNGGPFDSRNNLTSTIKYVSKLIDAQTNKPKVDEKIVQTNLKNGETVHQLQPKADTEKILITFEFADTVREEEINRFPGVDEYMQVTMLNKSLTVGSTVQIKVQSTEDIKKLHLLIFSTKGIIHSETFDKAVGKDVFDFPLELTDEMRPEARGLVFYTRASDGAMIDDEFSLSIGFSIDNSLDIFAPEQAEPNKMVDITVKTEKDSQVFLIATDVNSALFSHDSEISRTAIYNELVYHLNSKFKSTSGYHFEKLNAFILDPLKNRNSCGMNPRFGVDDDSEQITEIDKTPHKYFPEALDDVVFIATSSENETVQIKMPDSTTTWKIYGISIHPTKGFTVAKTQPEIAVKGLEKMEKLKLEIEGPSAISQDEVHYVKIFAINEIRSHLNARVSVNVEDGTFIKEVPSGNQNCRQHKELSYEEFDVQFTPINNIIYGTIQVSSKGIKPLKVRASITAGKVKTDATLEIEVRKNIKNLMRSSLSTDLIDIQHLSDSFSKDLNTTDGSTNTFATIYGNILGPAIDGLEKILSRKMILEEDKVLKFGTEVVIYQFLKNTGLQNNAKAPIVLDNIKRYYQEVKQILQDIIYKNDSNRIWLAALITDIIIDAQSIINIDRYLVEYSLTFIKNQYIQNHYKFPYDANYDFRRDISSPFRETIQTALISKVLLRSSNPHTQNTFSRILSNLFDNRAGYKGDHINTIVAYTLAFHGKLDNAKTVLKNVKQSSSGKKIYPHHYTMYVEMISYKILTKIMLNQHPKDQVKALLKHRNAEGAFYSPYDTYLAIKALSMYSQYRNLRKSRFDFYLDGNPNTIEQLESKTFNVDGNVQKLTATNKELGYVNVYKEELEPSTTKNPALSLKDLRISKENANTLNIFMKIFYNHTTVIQSNLVALEVDLPEGYKYSTYGGSTNVIAVELQEDQKLILYINNVYKEVEYSQSVRVTEKPNANKFHKPLHIRIYDYYRPNLKDVSSYNLLCI